jgi:hypothetical protein
MAISVFCSKCSEELEEPGALVFSPPQSDVVVNKFHVCKKCFKMVAFLIAEG